MPYWRAVIFDLDDTLYPERSFVLSGFRAVAVHVAARFGLPAAQGYAELAAYFAAGIRGDTFDRWIAAHGWPTGLARELIAVYRDHTPELRPFPGVVALLETLRQHLALGLVSDGQLAVQRRKLTALGLERYFDAVVFSDALGRACWKPSPAPFRAVLARLGVAGPEAVYIADNPTKDFLGARAVGLDTIWLHAPDGEYSDRLPPSAAHSAGLLLDSFTALDALLRERVRVSANAPFVGLRGAAQSAGDRNKE